MRVCVYLYVYMRICVYACIRACMLTITISRAVDYYIIVKLRNETTMQ